ncbi:hemerythrin domain-containing protein [Nocardioides sp. CER19]|uniref:hemerythrin domain-containing protein n=1 Tax=Nocardioides sp. CER19 TaxID=3038538 RepID=UPI00244CC21F|nr:hemerythrin domain-containing protein [Nocardioides sp. CER19]MDH2416206.1 hemerythrin domain-containing protein [Nocardioides sp. CER19]
MSTYAESRADAWTRRASIVGEVDFTMMYIAHDAFNRDMARLIAAADAGQGSSPPAQATWRSFAKHLQTHHHAEDKALWPRLAGAVADPAESRVLAQMETEHASIDPRLDQIEASMKRASDAELADALQTLAEELAAHMVHEESEALPLLERRLGQAGWTAFTQEIRHQQGGIKGASEYLPWVLDGATDQIQQQVLRMLPAPARLLYRVRWEPTYRNATRLR